MSQETYINLFYFGMSIYSLQTNNFDPQQRTSPITSSIYLKTGALSSLNRSLNKTSTMSSNSTTEYSYGSGPVYGSSSGGRGYPNSEGKSHAGKFDKVIKKEKKQEKKKVKKEQAKKREDRVSKTYEIYLTIIDNLQGKKD